MFIDSPISKLACALALLVAGCLLQSAPSARQATNTATTPATTFSIPAPPEADIPLAPANAAAVKTPSAPDAWGGARTGKESTLSDRVVTYQIEAQLDPVKHTVDGKQKLTWRNRSKREVRSVYMHLYMNAFEGAGSTFFTEQRNLSFNFRSGVDIDEGGWGHIEMRKVSQGGASVPWQFVQPDGGPKTDHTVVKLDLPTPVPAGGSTTLDFVFHNQLPRVIARTGYFGSFHLVAQWFPKIAVLELPGERGLSHERWNAHEMHMNSEFYADYGLYDVKLTVPKGYTVGATGEEQGAPVEKNGLLTHHFIQGDVHDFAWTADNRTAPPLIGETKAEAGVPKVKIKVLFPPEYASHAAPALKATQDAIAYFSKTLGPYPYKNVTVVVPPFNAGEAGGMEYPTFFTTVSYPGLTPNTFAADSLDFVTIHEFGHDYFYGILGSNEFEEPMLDEGLNEYWDVRMLREQGSRMPIATRLTNALGLGVTGDNFELRRLASANHDPLDGLGQNSWNRYSSGSYGTVYSRTATMMHDLEQRLGKSVMERAFKQYYENWKFRHPSIADLRETLAVSSGQRAVVEAAFAQQVYSTRKIDDRIHRIVSKQDEPQPGTRQVAGKWVEETEEQVKKRIEADRERWKKANPKAKKGVGGPYPWRTTVMLRRSGAAVPQTLVVKFADGSQEKVVWDNDQVWQRYTWLKTAKAVSAEIDPERSHLLDTNKLDDSRTIQADRSATRRWTSELVALAQIIFSLLVAL
jgi:Peptidase family M1 domain